MEINYQLKRADFIFKNENDWKDVLKKNINRPPHELINELISSELKGRGGAGFPTGLKWKLSVTTHPLVSKLVILGISSIALHKRV